MESTRFDHLTKTLAHGVSRRTLLKTVAGLVGGGAVAARGGTAGAVICREPGVLCAKDANCCSGSCGGDHRCACPDGQTLCGRTCQDLSGDVNNCGACGVVCTTDIANASPTCDGGTCGAVCDAGYQSCADGSCVPASGCCVNDDCSHLTDACHQGVCQDHTCVAQVQQGQACDDDDACTTDTSCQADGSCGDGTPLNCDDGLACTTDSCDRESGCVHTLQSGFCLIGGTCYARGAVNPTNPCQLCDPSTATDAWANAAQGTSCGAGASCTPGNTDTPATATTALICDGAGSCQGGTTSSCGLNTGCNGPVCAKNCSSEADCVGSAYCDPTNQTCQNDLANGQPCTVNDECISNYCVGGTCQASGTVCGNVACGGTTPTCCPDGTCVASGGCCSNDDCSNCQTCSQGVCGGGCDASQCQICGQDNTCIPADYGTTCGPNGAICVNGQCCASGTSCDFGALKLCCPNDTDVCLEGQCCASGNVCGTAPNQTCCASDETCTSTGACCPTEQLCVKSNGFKLCCPSGQTCTIHGACCPTASICGTIEYCCFSDQVCAGEGDAAYCCNPETCQPGQCGMVSNNCGGMMDCGDCVDCSTLPDGTTCGAYSTGACLKGECFQAFAIGPGPGDFCGACCVPSPWVPGQCTAVTSSPPEFSTELCMSPSAPGGTLCAAGLPTCSVSTDCPDSSYCGPVQCGGDIGIRYFCIPGCII